MEIVILLAIVILLTMQYAMLNNFDEIRKIIIAARP